MREAADLAVARRRALEIEVGEGMRLHGVGRDPEMPQQRIADQVRGFAACGTDAEIEVRLPEVHRQQLRVAVGEVQQAQVAEPRRRI